MSKELNKAPVEQAGGDERAADAKPCATRCPDCGEHDLMPGDLCACGYETDPATGYACSECDGSGEGCVGEVCRECDGSGWFVTPDQARAALAQPSPKCSTCNGSKVVSTTDTDHNGDYIEAPCPKCGGTGEADSGGVHPWGEPVLIPCDCETEKAEAERPVVVARLYRSNDLTMTPFAEVQKPLPLPASDGTLTVDALMTVAQHERIVEARWNRAMDLMGEHVARISEKLKAERDAALARVAEMERQEPVATVAKVPGEDWNSLDFHRDLQDMQPGTKLYAAPAAQAQQLHDLDKQCRDDVARALGLRPSQERGFAWSYLLASIKSCVKASEDAAQAQHSVPEGWMLVPVEPTQAQLSAGQTAWLADPMRRSTTLYRAMLAAAPQPVTEGE